MSANIMVPFKKKEDDSKGRVESSAYRNRQRLTQLQAAEIYKAATEAYLEAVGPQGKGGGFEWMPGRSSNHKGLFSGLETS